MLYNKTNKIQIYIKRYLDNFMRIKFVTIILSMFVIACFFLSSCTGVNGVEYNTKYYQQNISKETIENNEARYITLKNNKSGIIRDYIGEYVREENIIKNFYFEVKFKYTQVDNTTIIITYRQQDRVFDDKNYDNQDTNCISQILIVSKNVIIISSDRIDYYFNENYLNDNEFLQ